MNPSLNGGDLIRDIDSAEGDTPVLWWLGRSGFVIKYSEIVLYVDPWLSPHAGRADPPLDPALVRHADLVLITHKHRGHLDEDTLAAMMHRSPRAKVILPKSIAGRMNAIGIDYLRMITVDADQRVDFNKYGAPATIFAVPAAHPNLDWTHEGGYPYLGYVMRFGDFSIYHAGDCVPYDGLVYRLRQLGVTVALLPINGRGNGSAGGTFDPIEAAQLAVDVGARWVVPMHYDSRNEPGGRIHAFVDHMLGQRPELRFKVFTCGERWQIPAN